MRKTWTPVVRFRSARAGVNGKDCRAGIVRTVEHLAHFHFGDSLFGSALKSFSMFVEQRLVVSDFAISRVRKASSHVEDAFFHASRAT